MGRADEGSDMKAAPTGCQHCQGAQGRWPFLEKGRKEAMCGALGSTMETPPHAAPPAVRA